MNNKYFRFLFSYINALIIGISVGIWSSNVLSGVAAMVVCMFIFLFFVTVLLDN